MICAAARKPISASEVPPVSNAMTIARFFKVVTIMTILRTLVLARRTCWLKTLVEPRKFVAITTNRREQW